MADLKTDHFDNLVDFHAKFGQYPMQNQLQSLDQYHQLVAESLKLGVVQPGLMLQPKDKSVRVS